MPPGRFSNSGTPGAPLRCNVGTIRRSERCGVNSGAMDQWLRFRGCKCRRQEQNQREKTRLTWPDPRRPIWSSIVPQVTDPAAHRRFLRPAAVPRRNHPGGVGLMAWPSCLSHGGLPCPARIVSPQTWLFSSAVRRYLVWLRSLLNAAGVALKLQSRHLNRKLFSDAIRRSRERIGLGLC